MKTPEDKRFRKVEAEMLKRISEEGKRPSHGPEVFTPVIIHPLFTFRHRGMVRPRGGGWGLVVVAE